MNLATSSAITMSSRELTLFVNQHRKSESQRNGNKPFATLRHADFLAKVPVVLGDTSTKFFVHEEIQNGATKRMMPSYKFPKREACLMAMSYSYELQAAVFDRMTELESAQVPALPKSFADALRLAADQQEQIEQQAQQLAIAAPKVEFVDKYVEATGLKGFRQVAKLLDAKERALGEFLESQKIMYWLGGERVPYANHIDAGRFSVKTGQAENGHAFNSAKFTPKGVQWLSELWNKSGESK